MEKYRLVEFQDIETDEHTLNVIGNGFDLLHGVKSSYYDFQSTIGKSNRLRYALEEFLNTDNLWCDFERALGHLKVSKMINGVIMDMWLDNFDAYSRHSSSADYFAAIDAAIDPAYTIVNDLPRRFRMWIESLSVDKNNMLLPNLFNNGRVLNFNYTEFVETLYGIKHSRVCYIHGCRVKQKYKPKQELILGHKPDEIDEEFGYADFDVPVWIKSRRKKEIIETAIMDAASRISWYDMDTTKHCDKIIDNHKDFFLSLKEVDKVVVVGHSLADVDYDYFREIIKNTSPNIDWYISYHSDNDLKNIDAFVAEMGIDEAKVNIYKL